VYDADMSRPSNQDRADAALRRLTSEAVRAESEWTALLVKAGVYGCVDLLTVAYDALFNSFAARLMRLYDEHREAAGLTYLLQAQTCLTRSFEDEGLTNEVRKTLSSKLKVVRDKTHMHLDKHYVGDLRRAWNSSALDVESVDMRVRKTARALRLAYQARFGSEFAEASYDARDLPSILSALRSAPGVWHPRIQGGEA
jgi:hypothetical protein